jgi:hypothetical protein
MLPEVKISVAGNKIISSGKADSRKQRSITKL